MARNLNAHVRRPMTAQSGTTIRTILQQNDTKFGKVASFDATTGRCMVEFDGYQQELQTRQFAMVAAPPKHPPPAKAQSMRIQPVAIPIWNEM